MWEKCSKLCATKMCDNFKTLKLVKVSFGFTSQLKLKTLNLNVKPKIKAKTKTQNGSFQQREGFNWFDERGKCQLKVLESSP